MYFCRTNPIVQSAMRNFFFLGCLVLFGLSLQPLMGQPVKNKDLYDVPVEKARLVPVFMPICKQASFISHEHLVCLSNDGHAIAYPLFLTEDSTCFDLASSSFQPHCNVANVRKRKGQDYIYVSEWDGHRRLFVEMVKRDRLTATWDARMVQTITTDIPDSIAGGGFRDWVVDTDNDRLYAHTYLEGTPGNDRTGTAVVLLEFALPPLDSPTVVLQVDDILRQKRFPMIYVTQDKEIYKGKLLVLAGLRTKKSENWDDSRKLLVIDLLSMKVEKLIDMSFYFDEPEGIDIYRDKVYVTFRRGTFLLENKLIN